ncbi:MAG TPA: hypothetical protein VFN68_03360 [Acidimicrobiales bacterium]|nr:hypothetical protein [Acidimicrobiales bacterium]
MRSRFTKAMLALGISGAALGVGFGASSAIASAASTSTTTPSSSTPSNPPSTTHNCPHPAGTGGTGSTSAAAFYR